MFCLQPRLLAGQRNTMTATTFNITCFVWKELRRCVEQIQNIRSCIYSISTSCRSRQLFLHKQINMSCYMEDMCPSGDIIPDVGPTEQKYMLHVSSHALCLTSPVFKAMLNSKFLEGTSKFGSDERRVRLPDDDFNAVVIFCEISHIRGTAMDAFTLDEFGELSVFCDKYDATEAAMLWSTLHFTRFLSESSRCFTSLLLGRIDPDRQHGEVVRLLYIAYAFENHRGFAQASRNILSAYHTDTYRKCRERICTPIVGRSGYTRPFGF